MMNHTNTDRRILAFLEYDGRATHGLLVRETDRSHAHIERRVRKLREAGEIEYRDEETALYQLA